MNHHWSVCFVLDLWKCESECCSAVALLSVYVHIITCIYINDQWSNNKLIALTEILHANDVYMHAKRSFSFSSDCGGQLYFSLLFCSIILFLFLLLRKNYIIRLIFQYIIFLIFENNHFQLKTKKERPECSRYAEKYWNRCRIYIIKHFGFACRT